MADLWNVRAEQKAQNDGERPFASMTKDELDAAIAALLDQTGISLSISRTSVQRDNVSVNVLSGNGNQPRPLAERVSFVREQTPAPPLLPAEREINYIGDQGFEESDSDPEDDGIVVVADVAPIGGAIP